MEWASRTAMDLHERAPEERQHSATSWQNAKRVPAARSTPSGRLEGHLVSTLTGL